MSQSIDRFCEELRIKLTAIDDRLRGLKAKIDGGIQHAEQEVREQLERAHGRLEQQQARLAAAKSEIKNWAETEKATTRDQVAAWKAARETARLQRRADDTERYAAAMIEVAVAALDEAEQASLEAWLARQDADSINAG